jgi:hypothetical protein
MGSGLESPVGGRRVRPYSRRERTGHPRSGGLPACLCSRGPAPPARATSPRWPYATIIVNQTPGALCGGLMKEGARLVCTQPGSAALHAALR